MCNLLLIFYFKYSRGKTVENCFDREDEIFIVLKNSEEQYSLWPHWKDIPGGWINTGMQGDKNSCLDFVKKNWVDMRPLSLQKWMDQKDNAE